MIIRTIRVTPFEQNARVVADEESGDVLVVDPGGEVERILAAVPGATLRDSRSPDEPPYMVKGVVLTHAHIDHAGGVRRILGLLELRYGARPLLYGHPGERMMRQSLGQQALMFGLSPAEYENVPEPDVLIEEGAVVPLGKKGFRVLFTPGHSPGHVSLYHPETSIGERTVPILLAGDALFAGSIGRTDLPGGNHQQLLRSIREKLLPLPGNTLVLSGHGDDTTIERERRSNPFLTGL